MTAKATLRNLDEVLRDEMVERDRIAKLLHEGPKTLPEIATALGRPVEEVTQWVMAMRRYGRIRDLPKDRTEDYYRYALVEAGR